MKIRIKKTNTKMEKPNFKNIQYQRQNEPIKAEIKWQTPEGIDIQTVYDKSVVEGYEHLDFGAIPATKSKCS